MFLRSLSAKGSRKCMISRNLARKWVSWMPIARRDVEDRSRLVGGSRIGVTSRNGSGAPAHDDRRETAHDAPLQLGLRDMNSKERPLRANGGAHIGDSLDDSDFKAID